MEIGESVVGLGKEVKNFAIIFDQVPYNASFYLYNIQNIHSNLTIKTAETATHSLLNK